MRSSGERDEYDNMVPLTSDCVRIWAGWQPGPTWRRVPATRREAGVGRKVRLYTQVKVESEPSPTELEFGGRDFSGICSGFVELASGTTVEYKREKTALAFRP
jgi:hypothetical protein